MNRAINIDFIYSETTTEYLNALNQGKSPTPKEMKDFVDKIKEEMQDSNPNLFAKQYIVYCFSKYGYPTVPTASRVFTKGEITYDQFMKHMMMPVKYQGVDMNDDEEKVFFYDRFMVAPVDRAVPLDPAVDPNGAVPDECLMLDSKAALEEWFNRRES